MDWIVFLHAFVYLAFWLTNLSFQQAVNKFLSDVTRLWRSGADSVTSTNVHGLAGMAQPVMALSYSVYLAVWGLVGILEAVLARSRLKSGEGIYRVLRPVLEPGLPRKYLNHTPL